MWSVCVYASAFGLCAVFAIDRTAIVAVFYISVFILCVISSHSLYENFILFRAVSFWVSYHVISSGFCLISFSFEWATATTMTNTLYIYFQPLLSKNACILHYSRSLNDANIMQRTVVFIRIASHQI